MFEYIQKKIGKNILINARPDLHNNDSVLLFLQHPALMLTPLTMTARDGGNANRLSGTIFAFL